MRLLLPRTATVVTFTVSHLPAARDGGNACLDFLLTL